MFFSAESRLAVIFAVFSVFFRVCSIHIARFACRNVRPFFVRPQRPSHTERNRPLNRFVRLQSSFYAISFMILLIISTRRFFSIYKFFCSVYYWPFRIQICVLFCPVLARWLHYIWLFEFSTQFDNSPLTHHLSFRSDGHFKSTHDSFCRLVQVHSCAEWDVSPRPAS